MVLLNKITSSTIHKGQDPSGLGRWMLITIIGKNNNRTLIFTICYPCNSNIESVGGSTTIKKQWILLQEQKRDEHLHIVAIKSIIKIIKTFQQDGQKIIITFDGNEPFTQEKGDIASLCRECQLYYPLHYLHGEKFEEKSYIRGKLRIDFIFYTQKIMQTIKDGGMTVFNDNTYSDHRRLWIDIQKDAIVNKVHSTSTSPFQRKWNSIYINKKIDTNQYEIKVINLLDIVNKRRLSPKEEQTLNSIYTNITTIMFKTEKFITSH